MSEARLAELWEETHAHFNDLAARGLKLDLTRGKPSAEQLDLSNDLLQLPTTWVGHGGVDVRNYGGLHGLIELRGLFAELLGVDVAEIIAQGNSSLTLMSQALTYGLLHGMVDSEQPWSREPVVRFICPVPGYDRHFALLASLGIEMVTVPMHDDGPDAGAVAALVRDDSTIKGMWVVPVYANPTGQTVTREVAEQLVTMPAAAPDFTILWDNAYAMHHLGEDTELRQLDILSMAAAAGQPNRPICFASTSKITFAGAGVAFLAASTDVIAWFTGHLAMSSIGPDKINQLRHVEFFGDADGVRTHMRRHAAIVKPKFDEVERTLSERLGEYDVARWTTPRGGYFVNLDVTPGTAARVVSLAAEAGVSLTPAGSSFPHGRDPSDTNIRLAPTAPPLAEVSEAMDVLATAVLLAAIEKRRPSAGPHP